MPDPSDPPRPSLRQGVRNYIASCVWDQNQSRLETSGGDPVYAWLNQTGTPSTTATVQWEAGTANDLKDAVPAAIPQGSHTIIANGTYDAQTGLVTYNGKSYRFRFEMVSGTATMQAYS